MRQGGIKMTKQEKLSMIKRAMITIAQNKSLNKNAKRRGLESLKQAYLKNYSSNNSDK